MWIIDLNLIIYSFDGGGIKIYIIGEGVIFIS